jgi:hypothetical protein
MQLIDYLLLTALLTAGAAAFYSVLMRWVRTPSRQKPKVSKWKAHADGAAFAPRRSPSIGHTAAMARVSWFTNRSPVRDEAQTK